KTKNAQEQTRCPDSSGCHLALKSDSCPFVSIRGFDQVPFGRQASQAEERWPGFLCLPLADCSRTHSRRRTSRVLESLPSRNDGPLLGPGLVGRSRNRRLEFEVVILWGCIPGLFPLEPDERVSRRW